MLVAYKRLDSVGSIRSLAKVPRSRMQCVPGELAIILFLVTYLPCGTLPSHILLVGMVLTLSAVQHLAPTLGIQEVARTDSRDLLPLHKPRL